MARRLPLLAGLIALAGCGATARVGQKADKPTVLTMVNIATDPGELLRFAQQVQRLSDGRLRIRFIHSPHVGETDFEQADIRDVEQGRYDLGWAGTRVWDAFGIASMRALTAPLLIDSYPLEQRVLESGLVHPMLAQLRRLGLVGLSVQASAMRKPFGHTEMTTPAGWRGQTVGTQESTVASATVRALGGRPVRVPVDPSLRGVDAIEQRVYGLGGNRLDVSGTHLATNVNLWPRPLVVFANARAFRQLMPEQQRTLRAAAAAAAAPAVEVARADEAELAATICRNGKTAFDTASVADLRALRRSVEPVYAGLRRDPRTAAAIDAIEQLKTQVDAPPAGVARCRHTAPAAAPARTRLDGTWRMDTTRSAARPDFLDENWGNWIFVFDHGRFADTQENAHSCTWGYGTFSVDGDRTTWRFIDGGGEAPNNALNKPGEEFSFGLSSYRDTLTLRPVRGTISPVNFRDRPWRRVSATPSRRYFSRRCPPPEAALAVGR